MTVRAAPMQARSRATYERILAAANELFAARGSASVTTTQIADAAGVSVGALYRFFPDKRSVGEALADRYLADAVDRFGPSIDSITTLDRVPAGIGEIIATAGELALAHPGYYRLTDEVRPDDVESVGHSVRTAMIDTFDDLIVRLGSVQPNAVRRAAVTMVIETVRHTLATAPVDEPMRSIVLGELADMVTTYARRRLAPP
ncbi:MAG: helix-turn-helix domain-containing protein [Actinomycetota bacterium]